jgi:DNA-binding MarR family transcriptional regulator
MSIDIDEVFGDLYPGSKKRRRAVERSVQEVEPAWDATPTIKVYNGKPTEFFNLGALAKAIGKKPVSVRLWERRGYLPAAPYRLPGFTDGQGNEIAGRRLYSRALITAVVDEFAKRDLLGKKRVEWKRHTDLTIAIAERWQRILNTEETT